MDVEEWTEKHVFKKLDAYVRARLYLDGWENSPINLKFTIPGVNPSLGNAVEASVETWRQGNSEVDVKIRRNE
jgi:hypothetical protein